MFSPKCFCLQAPILPWKAELLGSHLIQSPELKKVNIIFSLCLAYAYCLEAKFLDIQHQNNYKHSDTVKYYQFSFPRQISCQEDKAEKQK